MWLYTRWTTAFYFIFGPFFLEFLEFLPLFPDFTYAETPLQYLLQDNFSENVFSTNLRRILQCSETRTFPGNQSNYIEQEERYCILQFLLCCSKTTDGSGSRCTTISIIRPLVMGKTDTYFRCSILLNAYIISCYPFHTTIFMKKYLWKYSNKQHCNETVLWIYSLKVLKENF